MTPSSQTCSIESASVPIALGKEVHLADGSGLKKASAVAVAVNAAPRGKPLGEAIPFPRAALGMVPKGVQDLDGVVGGCAVDGATPVVLSWLGKCTGSQRRVGGRHLRWPAFRWPSCRVCGC